MRPWLQVGSDAEVESDLTSKARRQAAYVFPAMASSSHVRASVLGHLGTTVQTQRDGSTETSRRQVGRAAQSGNHSSRQAVGVHASQLQLMLIPIDLLERSRIDEHSAGDS
jgi:hypothetical protein